MRLSKTPPVILRLMFAAFIMLAGLGLSVTGVHAAEGLLSPTPAKPLAAAPASVVPAYKPDAVPEDAGQDADAHAAADAAAANAADAAAVSKIKIEKDQTTEDDNDLGAPLRMLDKLSQETRDKLLAEAETSKSYCTSNLMLSSFYDCGCVSLRILKQRLDVGPDPDLSALIMDADYKPCASAPLAAGYALEHCNTLLMSERITTAQMNKICECTARTMARDFSANPTSQIERATDLFDNTISACRTENGF